MRSVVVVLPASMCAMIPMLRVFSSVNLRGIDQESRFRGLGAVAGEKNGPLGPTRAAGLCWTGPRRYLLEVSILITDSRGYRAGAAVPPATRSATIAEGFAILGRLPARGRRLHGALRGSPAALRGGSCSNISPRRSSTLVAARSSRGADALQRPLPARLPGLALGLDLARAQRCQPRDDDPPVALRARPLDVAPTRRGASSIWVTVARRQPRRGRQLPGRAARRAPAARSAARTARG